MTRHYSLITLGSLPLLLCWWMLSPLAASAASATTGASSLHERLKKATVRIEVAESGVRESGSGTIVQRVGTHALVVTCAHIFEATKGRVPFQVTLFEAGRQRSLPGKLLAHDFRLDVALVAIDGVGDVEPIPVPAVHPYSIGEPLLVAGCDLGGTPATWDTHLTAVSRFSGRPNVEVAEIPQDGRSGGGLVTAAGTFVGVCNGINPIENEGIYAAIEAVQQQFAKAGLSASHDLSGHVASPGGETPRSPVPSTSAPLPPTARAMPSPAPPHPDPVDNLAPPDDAMPVVTRPRRAEAVAAQASPQVRPRTGAATTPGDIEVICIVRAQGDAEASSKVIVLKDASPEFLRAMAAERRRTED